MPSALTVESVIRCGFQGYCSGKCRSLKAELGPALTAVHTSFEIVFGEELDFSLRAVYGNVVKGKICILRRIVLNEKLKNIILAEIMPVGYVQGNIESIYGICLDGVAFLVLDDIQVRCLYVPPDRLLGSGIIVNGIASTALGVVIVDQLSVLVFPLLALIQTLPLG